MTELIQYKCKTCNKSFFLLDEEVEHNEKEDKYITCPFNGRHKNITVTSKYDNVKEVMESVDIFKRVNGRYRKVK